MLSQEIHFLASESIPHHLNASIAESCESISNASFHVSTNPSNCGSPHTAHFQ